MGARLRLFVAVAAFVAPALFAGGLDKYRDWPNSPQGYFMTAAERAAWKATVKNDAQAEDFVKKFLARRDPGFADDVVRRAEVADKRLTVSGRKGSLTTRGKLVILLGPPSSFAIADRLVKGHISASADMYASAAGGGPGTQGGGPGVSVGDMAMAANNRGMSENLLKDYTFIYTADKLPGKATKDLSVVVEVKPSDGTDRIVDRKKIAELDEIFEQVAQSRLAPPKP